MSTADTPGRVGFRGVCLTLPTLSREVEMLAREGGTLANAYALLRRNWVRVRAGLLFTSALSVWLVWYPRLVDAEVLAGFLRFNASLTGSALRVLGTGVEVSGNMVSSPDFAMEITHECTAIVPAVILFCAALAYPSNLRQKLACLAIGLPALFLLNQVRIVSLYYVGAFVPDMFDIVHFVVWQAVMVLAVVLLWLVWAGRVVHVRPA